MSGPERDVGEKARVETGEAGTSDPNSTTTLTSTSTPISSPSPTPIPSSPVESNNPASAAPRPPRLSPAPLLLAILALYPVGIAAQAVLPAAGLIWTQLFAFALPAAALAARAGLRPAPVLRLAPPPPGALPLAALAGLLAFLAGGALMALWASLLPASLVKAFDVTRIFQQPGWAQWAVVGAAAVLAPLCEEAAFRGHLLTALGLRLRPGAAIAASAALFGAMHLDPVRLPAVAGLGALYGWLTWRSGSLWPAVLAHAVNNAAATALALQAGSASRESSPEGSAPGAALAALRVLLPALAALWPVLWAYQRTTPSPPSAASALVASGEGRAGWTWWAALAGIVALLLIALLASPPPAVPR